MQKQMIEILFTDEVKVDDLEIIREATWQQPGLAQLGTATLGDVTPDAPMSQPLYSRTGAKFGFVANLPPEPPYTHTYWLQEGHDAED